MNKTSFETWARDTVRTRFLDKEPTHFCNDRGPSAECTECVALDALIAGEDGEWEAIAEEPNE